MTPTLIRIGHRFSPDQNPLIGTVTSVMNQGLFQVTFQVYRRVYTKTAGGITETTRVQLEYDSGPFIREVGAIEMFDRWFATGRTTNNAA